MSKENPATEMSLSKGHKSCRYCQFLLNAGTELLQPPVAFPGKLWEAELVSPAPWFAVLELFADLTFPVMLYRPNLVHSFI